LSSVFLFFFISSIIDSICGLISIHCVLIFGSHLSNVIRRLKRICNFYGSDPKFICSSATIANPQEIAEKITGTSIAVIDNNGAPSGEKHFLFSRDLWSFFFSFSGPGARIQSSKRS